MKKFCFTFASHLNNNKCYRYHFLDSNFLRVGGNFHISYFWKKKFKKCETTWAESCSIADAIVFMKSQSNAVSNCATTAMVRIVAEGIAKDVLYFNTWQHRDPAEAIATNSDKALSRILNETLTSDLSVLKYNIVDLVSLLKQIFK